MSNLLANTFLALAKLSGYNAAQPNTVKPQATLESFSGSVASYR